MELFLIIFLQLALIASTFVFIVIFGTAMISEGYQVPLVRTPRAYIPAIAEALQIRTGDIVYDLGSGDGRVVLMLAQRFPSAKFIGIERNPILAAYSNLKARRIANASFVCADMFTADFSDATRVYTYLKTKPLNELHARGKLKAVRLVSRAFRLNGIPAETTTLSEKPGSHGEHLLHTYEL